MRELHKFASILLLLSANAYAEGPASLNIQPVQAQPAQMQQGQPAPAQPAQMQQSQPAQMQQGQPAQMQQGQPAQMQQGQPAQMQQVQPAQIQPQATATKPLCPCNFIYRSNQPVLMSICGVTNVNQPDKKSTILTLSFSNAPTGSNPNTEEDFKAIKESTKKWILSETDKSAAPGNTSNYSGICADGDSNQATTPLKSKEEYESCMQDIMSSAKSFGVSCTPTLRTPEPPVKKESPQEIKFKEIINATALYKIAVTECMKKTLATTECNAGSNGIPAAITQPVGMITSLTVQDGKITIIPAAKSGITASDTYILMPKVEADGSITFTSSGGAVTKGYAK